MWHDEDGVDLASVCGGNGGVVAILVAEVAVGVVGGGEGLPLELYGGEGEDGVGAVVHAAAVVYGVVAVVGVGAA